MKKIEHSVAFLNQNLNLFRCPHCTSAFSSVDKQGLCCQLGHSFNLSKKGCLHFLKKSGASLYGPGLFKARGRVNTWGMFHPVYKEIEIIARPYLNSGVVLDMGCGEGSLVEHLAKNFSGPSYLGLDNAKEAINAAASKNWHALYMAADLAQPPLGENSIDLLLNFFSPANYPQFKSLVKKKGLVVKVIPAEKYLAELREILYADKNEKQNFDPGQTKSLFFKHFPNSRSRDIKYTLEISEDRKLDIINMTPLSWGASPSILEAAKSNTLSSVTVDIALLWAANI